MGNISLEHILIQSLDTSSKYFDSTKDLVQKILPDSFLKDSLNEQIMYLNDNLPIIKWSDIKYYPSSLSVVLMCKKKIGAFNFFHDLITRWLIPQKKLDTEIFFLSDFILSGFSDKFTIGEIVVNISNENDVAEVIKNKRVIDTEIRLGVTSNFHANRIMQFKGLSYDKKTTMIQEKIASLIQSRSKDFGQSIFSHMQQFLVTCSEEFKIQRDYHHLSRIISVLYLMKKMLETRIKEEANKRHVFLKFFKTKVYKDRKEKEVLGVIVGLNFIKEHEVFEKKHLLEAIRVFVPEAVSIESSYIIDKNTQDAIQTIYLEVEKQKNDFTYDEIKKMRQNLISEIKAHVEHLVHRIFMPRNEEEVVRNILTLSRQLKFVNDIPQVIINFDEQTENDLSFTVILLRILKSSTPTVHDMFKEIKTLVKFLPDRIKKVGILRRKYLKEANVFKILIPSQNYVRKDQSVDLNKARVDVIKELNKIFVDVRDYNGGMIFKQNEALNVLKEILGKQNELLLERFFYAIRPVEMAIIILPQNLKSLFLMLLNAIKREETRIKKHNNYLFKKETKAVYVIIPIYDLAKKRQVKDTISKYYLLSSDFISFDLSFNEINYLGYIFNSDDDLRQKNFLKVLQQALSK